MIKSWRTFYRLVGREDTFGRREDVKGNTPRNVEQLRVHLNSRSLVLCCSPGAGRSLQINLVRFPFSQDGQDGTYTSWVPKSMFYLRSGDLVVDTTHMAG